jgi:hypothetical protein
MMQARVGMCRVIRLDWRGGSASTFAYVEGNPVSLVEPFGLQYVDPMLQIANRIAGISESSPVTTAVTSGAIGISANIPVGSIRGIPTGINISAKSKDGHGSCYVGVGVMTGGNISFPRLSDTNSDTNGKDGFSTKVSISSPSVFKGMGYTYSKNYYSDGSSSVSQGPSAVGGKPSAGIFYGYTFKW